jgi:uncharacterized protein DUF4411
VLYLLDANVLIDADRDYYPLDRVPEFWEWLLHHADAENVKLCVEVFEEITEGTGQLADWLETKSVKKALLLDEESDPVVVNRVVTEGYAADLTDIELVTVGRDPFLIAHCLANRENRSVVTTESSAPAKQRQNRRIPDVCTQFGVAWLSAFGFFRALDFRTRWR